MLRIIDLEQLVKDHETQTIFTFGVGGEKLGIPAGELFEILRSRLAQGSGAKGGRKNVPKRVQMSDNLDSVELSASQLNEGVESAEESSLS